MSSSLLENRFWLHRGARSRRRNVCAHLNVSTDENLFSNNPYSTFQCDGNLGFTAGVVEMLVQSHDRGVVHLISAVPEECDESGGRVSGLVGRGVLWWM